jgi:hypothetical protein
MEIKFTDEELRNPFNALDNVFANYTVVEIEMLLKEVQKHLFDRSYPHSKESNDYDNTLHFFENLNKLAHISFMLQKLYFKRLMQNDADNEGMSLN